MDLLWKDLSVAYPPIPPSAKLHSLFVSTLALAIGANIAVFSVVNAVLFRAALLKLRPTTLNSKIQQYKLVARSRARKKDLISSQVDHPTLGVGVRQVYGY